MPRRPLTAQDLAALDAGRFRRDRARLGSPGLLLDPAPLRAALQRNGGDVTRAAWELGCCRRWVYKALARLGLRPFLAECRRRRKAGLDLAAPF